MQNFNMEKRGLCFTAPAGGVVSGTAYLIGAVLAVAKVTAPAGAPFAAQLEGVVTLPVANLAVAEGVAVYWDNTAVNVTTVSTGGNVKIGFAALGGWAAGATTGAVALNGTV